jgi:hypothetical protein
MVRIILRRYMVTYIEKYEYSYIDLYEKVSQILPGITKEFRKIDTLPTVSTVSRADLVLNVYLRLSMSLCTGAISTLTAKNVRAFQE